MPESSASTRYVSSCRASGQCWGLPESLGHCWDQSPMSGQLEGAFWPSWPRLLLTNAHYSHPDSCCFFFSSSFGTYCSLTAGQPQETTAWMNKQRTNTKDKSHTQPISAWQPFFFSSRTRVFVAAYYTAQINIVIFSASKIAAGSYNGIKYVSISWCSAKSPITSRCSATGTSLRTTDL